MIGGIAVILIAIGVSTASQQETSFSQILTVGPVWTSDSWVCTSNADFMIHGTVRGIQGSLMQIEISDVGTQSLYALDEGQVESFSIGASAGHEIIITKSGTITGFLTLQTISNAEARCISL